MIRDHSNRKQKLKKDKQAAATRRWRARHPEAAKASLERWREANPDKVRKHQHAWWHSKKGKQWQEKNRKKRNAQARTWRKRNRDKWNRVKRNNYRKNAERINARRRQKRLADPGRFRTVDRKRYRRHKGKRIASQHRARAKRMKAVGAYTTKEVQALLVRFKHCCAYCKLKLTSKNQTLDHVVPLVRGGANTIENLVPACRPCNQRKNAMSVERFVSRCSS